MIIVLQNKIENNIRSYPVAFLLPSLWFVYKLRLVSSNIEQQLLQQTIEISGERINQLKGCKENRTVASSIHNMHSSKLRDSTSLRGSQ